MARELTIGRWIEIAVLGLFVVGLAAGIVVPMEAVPAFLSNATTERQVAMVGGTYAGIVLLLAVVYRMLPESRV